MFVAIGSLFAGVSAGAQHVIRDSIPGTLVTLELVRVSGGAARLDTPNGRRTIEVTPFLIGRTEVLWEAYDAFTLSRQPSPRYAAAGADAIAGPSRPYGNPDYGFGHKGFPVISVTRGAAEAFCAWLSSVTGGKYRLPTEAEWQRVADLALPDGDGGRLDAMAWHVGNAGGSTHAAGTKASDALGLHDLFGNVLEWVVPNDGGLVARGGSFRDPRDRVGPRSRARQTDAWNERDPQIPKSSWWLSDGPFVGFRVVRDP
ncbi:MAG: formylglycine-generating enzyme family protein [Gemmatimonadaceae bacterium]